MIGQVLLISISDFLGGRVLGEAVLVTVAAIVIGYVVSMIWPKQHNPSLFGFLAALTFAGGLAFMGSTGASLAIVLVLVIAGVFAAMGMF